MTDRVRPEAVYVSIHSRIEVSHELLVMAKQHILSEPSWRADEAINAFVAKVDARAPAQVVVHQSVPLEAQVEAVVRNVSAQLAVSEAVWALIGAGLVVPRDSTMSTARLGVSYTTVVPGSGGESGGWSFGELEMPIPQQFAIAPSKQAGMTYLTDGDLYLSTIAEEVHPVIGSSLRDAVACFRFDLYLPALAMLAKAAEGVWVLFADTLALETPDEERTQRLSQDIERGIHFASLVERATDLFARQDLFGDLAKRAGVTLAEVREAREWTTVVRDSRNVLHYDVAEPIPNTYEKTAALMLAAVPHLRVLLAVRDARAAPAEAEAVAAQATMSEAHGAKAD